MRTLMISALSAAAVLFGAAARTEDVAAGKQGPKAKVYTEEDLRAHRAPSAKSTPGAGLSIFPEEKPAEVCTTPAEKVKTEEEQQAEKEKDWRDRLEKAQAEMSRLMQELDRLQIQLNDLRGLIYGPGRTALVQAFEETKNRLAAAREQVDALEEEGRRSSFR